MSGCGNSEYKVVIVCVRSMCAACTYVCTYMHSYGTHV